MRSLRFLAIVLVVILFVSAAEFARAGIADTIGGQSGAAWYASGYAGAASDAAVPTIIAKIVNGTLALLGAIFFGLMVYAGYLWMTSRDESEQVDKAKETMRRAVIGLIIVLAAYAISKFITVAIQLGTGT